MEKNGTLFPNSNGGSAYTSTTSNNVNNNSNGNSSVVKEQAQDIELDDEYTGAFFDHALMETLFYNDIMTMEDDITTSNNNNTTSGNTASISRNDATTTTNIGPSDSFSVSSSTVGGGNESLGANNGGSASASSSLGTAMPPLVFASKSVIGGSVVGSVSGGNVGVGSNATNSSNSNNFDQAPLQQAYPRSVPAEEAVGAGTNSSSNSGNNFDLASLQQAYHRGVAAAEALSKPVPRVAMPPPNVSIPTQQQVYSYAPVVGQQQQQQHAHQTLHPQLQAQQQHPIAMRQQQQQQQVPQMYTRNSAPTATPYHQPPNLQNNRTNSSNTANPSSLHSPTAAPAGGATSSKSSDSAKQLVNQFASLASKLGIALPQNVLASLTTAAVIQEEKEQQVVVTSGPAANNSQLQLPQPQTTNTSISTTAPAQTPTNVNIMRQQQIPYHGMMHPSTQVGQSNNNAISQAPAPPPGSYATSTKPTTATQQQQCQIPIPSISNNNNQPLSHPGSNLATPYSPNLTHSQIPMPNTTAAAPGMPTAPNHSYLPTQQPQPTQPQKSTKAKTIEDTATAAVQAIDHHRKRALSAGSTTETTNKNGTKNASESNCGTNAPTTAAAGKEQNTTTSSSSSPPPTNTNHSNQTSNTTTQPSPTIPPITSSSSNRKRKRPRIDECEAKLTHLKEENRMLKRHLDTVLRKTQTFDLERTAAEQQMREMIHTNEGASNMEELNKVVNKFTEMYSDYGKCRQQELRFHLEQLQRLAAPTTFTKMTLWTLGQNDLFFQNPKRNTIGGILRHELQITPIQAKKMVERRHKIKAVSKHMKETLDLLERLRALCEHKQKMFSDRMTKCQEILTPLQVVKLLIWVDDNSGMLEKVCPGWGSERIRERKKVDKKVELVANSTPQVVGSGGVGATPATDAVSSNASVGHNVETPSEQAK